mgnify:CR=1 FL=1
MASKQYSIFINSVFFVLGFSVVFSLVGVLLQSVLSSIAFSVQKWLAYIGGTIIIFFGLYLVGLVRIAFLEQEHKLAIKRKFKYSYLTSFVFGAAFAVGWTPCVGAILGAILTLAVSNPASAFWLLFAYSLGLGFPFLLVGLFTNQAKSFIDKAGPWLKYLNIVFGVFLIALGVLVFTNNLSRVANIPFLTDIITNFGGEGSTWGSKLNIGVSFIAGLASFLSPCVLPIVPGFLSYLATTAITTAKKDEE